MTDRTADTAWLLVFGAWIVAAVSTLGALFASAVMDLPPCVLCWYQRIFMFPLAVVLPVGLFPFDARVVRYGAPLALIGWGIAAYHVLLVLKVVPESMAPCAQGIPCGSVPVTLPLASLVAFSIILALLAAAHFRSKP
jgi:disulfide bond formation protein DsbB